MKISPQELSGYWKAKLGISGLTKWDAYNLQIFGLDTLTYNKIDRAIQNMSGVKLIDPSFAPNLERVNEQLKSEIY